MLKTPFFAKITSDRAIPYISFVWGLAEGIFFFIVPDVFILFVALFSFRKGLKSWGYSILGSFVAVIILGLFDAIQAFYWLTYIPGISYEFAMQTFTTVKSQGLPYTFLLVLGGVPLKVYVVSAYILQYSTISILVWALFARIVRIAPGFILVSCIRLIFKKFIDPNPTPWIVNYVVGCIAFYIFYFSFI